MSFKGFFLFLALAAILFCVRNNFTNFGRGSFKEHFCEILKLEILFKGFFYFLALVAILFSGAEPF